MSSERIDLRTNESDQWSSQSSDAPVALNGDKLVSQMDPSPGRTVTVIVPASSEPVEIVLEAIDSKSGRRLKLVAPKGSRIRNRREKRVSKTEVGKSS